MKNRDLIRSVVIQRLTDDADMGGKVILLSGPWGCGKTYLWQNEVFPKLSDKAVITVSLFGLESIASLKTQLMNKCLILKAQSLKSGKLRKAITGGKNLILEGFKHTLKGVDSVIGTNLLSWNIDPIQLVDDNLIICFDDVERISAKVGLDEILGLTNLLSEHKNCKVLLLMNEDASTLRDGENAKTLKNYKERVVDYNIKVDTDIHTSYDLFIEKYKNQKNIYEYFKSHKSVIIQPMLYSDYGNLRTLKKCVDAIAEILMKVHYVLEPKFIPSFVVFNIEAADGELKGPDFYNFNEVSLKIAYSLLDKTTDQDSHQLDKLRFLKKYFGNSDGYIFIKEFYNYVVNGYLDYESLEHDINPKYPLQDELSKLLEVSNSRDWLFFSDEEYSIWIKKIEPHVFSDQPMSTYQLVSVLIKLNQASEMSGSNFNKEIEHKIRERLEINALSGDETFSVEERIYFSQHRSIWEPYIKEYDKLFKSTKMNQNIMEIVSLIENENFDELIKFVHKKPEGLIAIISEKSMLTLSDIFRKNRMFFNDVFTFIVDELNAYRNSQIIANVDEKISYVRQFVSKMLTEEKLDNADRRRLKMLLDKFPVIEKKDSTL